MIRPLAHPDAADATERPARNTFSELRGALIRALRASPEAVEPLCDALEIVEDLQRGMDREPPASSRPADRRQAGRAQAYEIQDTAEGPVLAEHRAGDQQPFRCPRATYDAAANVLSGSDEPLHFDELSERLNAQLGERQPDYRLRVALRFWMAKGAVLRSRSRYRGRERTGFAATAARLWDDLRRLQQENA